MTALLIGPETTVTLHFAIKLADGQVVDSNFDGKPATFTVGDGNMLQGFEKALFGLKSGDHKVLVITPEHGFGMPNPNNVQRLPRRQFEGMALEPGLVISFEDPGQGELPGVVESFDDQVVRIDFNHPLAGKTLTFEVSILAVNAA